MSVDSTLMELTPMSVTWTPAGGVATDLGGTIGNVAISIKYMKTPIHADQFGKSVIDKRVNGLDITVTTQLAQTKDFDIWKVVFPNSTEISTGTKAIDFKALIGDADTAHSGKLSLHPIKNASDLTQDFTFDKVCASGETEVVYGPDNQISLKVVWQVFPDTSVTPPKWGRYGAISL